jgi:hypothetical protein
LQRAVDHEAQRTAPRYSIEALKSIGPVDQRHINFRGTYRFPIDRYAGRLLQQRHSSTQDASFDRKGE